MLESTDAETMYAALAEFVEKELGESAVSDELLFDQIQVSK